MDALSKLSDLDVSGLVDTYNNGLEQILNQHAPLTTRCVKARSSAPWLTTEIRNARRERRRAERTWRKSMLTVHRDIYIKFRNHVKNCISVAKKQYFTAKIDSAASSSKQLFNISNDLLRKTSASVFPKDIDPDKLPDRFCQFFGDKIMTLREKLDSRQCNPPSFAVFEGPCFDHFDVVTEAEISELITKMPTKGCMLDPFPTSLVKDYSNYLVPIITVIIDKSLQSGIVPPQFKMAHITPVIKKLGLDQNVLKNYRPISNLAFISKLLEKVVLIQLQKHLHDNNLVELHQSAYRKGHSVETAVLSVMDCLLSNADEKLVSLVALLDLSAAFDTLDHSILTQRLDATFGVRGIVLDWFGSYVSGRFQSVTVNKLLSDPSPLLYGVPQGSVLGPVLFTLYSQPLSEILISHNCQFHKYADDTELSQCSLPNNFEAPKLCVQNCIMAIVGWMDSNKLMLNSDKTEILIVGTASRINQVDIDTIQILDSSISIQKSVKYLGVRLDSTLAMRDHISDVCRSIYLSLRRIGSIRHLLSDRATTCLVNALITSRLDFCNSTLAGINVDQVYRLQRLQNAAARLVAKKRKHDHISPVLFDLHWLPVSFRIKFKLCVLVYRHFEETLPPYLSSVLKTYHPHRCLRSSSDKLLVIPRVNLKSAGERSFRYVGSVEWNSLPKPLRFTPTLAQFKKNLKTHFFHLAFPDGS
jgi:hypothetical protein